MGPWRKLLAVLGGIAAVAALSNNLYYPYNKDVSQFIWSYIVDPVVLIIIGFNVLVNVSDSLKIPQPGRQSPNSVAPGRGHRLSGHRVGALRDAICRSDSPQPRTHLRVVGPLDGPGHRHSGLRSHLPVAVRRARRPWRFKLSLRSG